MIVHETRFPAKKRARTPFLAEGRSVSLRLEILRPLVRPTAMCLGVAARGLASLAAAFLPAGLAAAEVAGLAAAGLAAAGLAAAFALSAMDCDGGKHVREMNYAEATRRSTARL